MNTATTKSSRVLARYKGSHPGPLLIAIGASHGNEKAGIKAIRLLRKMLEVEPIRNPSFGYRGNFVGLVGNLSAAKQNVRFVDMDLNRQWTDQQVESIMNSNPKEISIREHYELRSLLSCIHQEVRRYRPEVVIVLDLHTTSSDGGIFVIPADQDESVDIAMQLHAPVIHEMLQGIEGTTLHYFQHRSIHGADCVPITFEAGQHGDPKSTNRCIAAIVNCMRAIGSVRSQDVENIHDQVLINYSANLPKSCRLVYTHQISKEDEFRMFPGFQNFMPIEKGQQLATDISGPVYTPHAGRILMPLYQVQGDDGFFVIEDVLSN
ncbi:MAG: succinylglutamate desuccinylase/aspartoacylase family protein [Bacteroidota bacterium]